MKMPFTGPLTSAHMYIFKVRRLLSIFFLSSCVCHHQGAQPWSGHICRWFLLLHGDFQVRTDTFVVSHTVEVTIFLLRNKMVHLFLQASTAPLLTGYHCALNIILTHCFPSNTPQPLFSKPQPSLLKNSSYLTQRKTLYGKRTILIYISGNSFLLSTDRSSWAEQKVPFDS